MEAIYHLKSPLLTLTTVSFYHLGLHLEVLKTLYNLVKDKANKLYMWKGVKWTKRKSALPAHLKVFVIACILFIKINLIAYF